MQYLQAVQIQERTLQRMLIQEFQSHNHNLDFLDTVKYYELHPNKILLSYESKKVRN